MKLFWTMIKSTNTMLYIEKMIKEQGIETIRLDAFSLNPYALKMHQSLGFKKVGEAQWRKGRKGRFC